MVRRFHWKGVWRPDGVSQAPEMGLCDPGNGISERNWSELDNQIDLFITGRTSKSSQ